MSPLEKARKLHAELMEMGGKEMHPVTADIDSAIHNIDRFLSKPAIDSREIKRARSARSYLRLILK